MDPDISLMIGGHGPVLPPALDLPLAGDDLKVTYGLTACTPGSAPGPTLGNEFGRTVFFSFLYF